MDSGLRPEANVLCEEQEIAGCAVQVWLHASRCTMAEQLTCCNPQDACTKHTHIPPMHLDHKPASTHIVTLHTCSRRWLFANDTCVTYLAERLYSLSCNAGVPQLHCKQTAVRRHARSRWRAHANPAGLSH